ncbi:cupin domain-containing protein [Streptomyces lasiicapitis]|uniref:cupin domain-containing protein n=1 Tax=Streptomyces TaxID=1883 RepID=UPI001E3B1D66|nr:MULTISPECIES: cupin domain-containing protein [Streptomyces]
MGTTERTQQDDILSALFPRAGATEVRRAVREGLRLVDIGEPAIIEGIRDSALFAHDARTLVRGHPHGVRLHLARSPGRYRADIVVDGPQGGAFFDDGVSVNLEEFDRVCPAADTLLDALAHALGVPRRFCGCSAFVSPPGSGLPLHFDDKDVVIVQVSGDKRWRLAANTGLRYPTANYAAGGRVSTELARYYRPEAPGAGAPEQCDTVDLGPGGSLFLPRGHWHGTEAHQDAASVSLSFGIAAPSWSTVFLERLRTRLLTVDHWRAPAVRLDGEGGRFLPADLVQHMDGAISELLSGPFGRALSEEIPQGRTTCPADVPSPAPQRGRRMGEENVGEHHDR